MHKNLCCDPSYEPSRRDGSDEGSQHMVSLRNMKNYPTVILSRAMHKVSAAGAAWSLDLIETKVAIKGGHKTPQEDKII